MESLYALTPQSQDSIFRDISVLAAKASASIRGRLAPDAVSIPREPCPTSENEYACRSNPLFTMFYTLLLVTFGIATSVSWITTRIFAKPADAILKRIIQDEIYASWLTYLKFALYVVGISSGVKLFQLERYITAPAWQNDAEIPELTPERWILELYRTVIETLQGLAWVLLVFFTIALLSFVVVRIFELKRFKKEGDGA